MKESNQQIKHLILNLAKDSLFYIPEKMFSVLYSFAGILIYTRIFSPAEYGDFSLIIATTGIFGIFVYSWINISNLRFFSSYRDNNKLENFFSTSFFILIGTLTCSSLLIYILSNYSLLPQIMVNYLILAIGVLFSTSFFETMQTILRSDRNSKAYSFFSISSSVLYITISLLLLYILNLRISAILLSYILTNSILSILIIFKYKFQKYIRFAYFSRETLNRFLSYGIPMIATLLFSWVLALSDRYFIEYFRNTNEVGIYSATYQLANYPISLISSLIFMASTPIIIDVWEKNGDEITKVLISNIVRYYLILSIPILFGLMFLSPDFIYLLGAKYAEGLTIIPWIATGSFAVGLNIYIYKGLELKKKTNIVSYIMCTAAVGNIVMNYILIPAYGFYGAGVSTAVSYILYLGLSWFVSWKYLPWKFPTNTIINCIVASVLMSCVIFILKLFIQESIPNLLILSAIGSIIYLIVIYTSNEINTEIDFIKNHCKNYIFSRKV